LTNTEYLIGITEVHEVLKNFDQDEVNKIPKPFLRFLEVNSNPDYKANLDFSQPLMSCGLRPQSVVLLTLIYNEFWCNKDQRYELQEILLDNSKKRKQKNDRLFSRNNIFENPDNKKVKNVVEKELVRNLEVEEVNIFDDEKEKEAKEILVVKDSFIKRLFKKILSIFGRG